MFSAKKDKFVLTLLASLFLAMALGAVTVNAQGQATVNISATNGGSTSPSGTQTYNDGDSVTITATSQAGVGGNANIVFLFQQWIISTATSSFISTDNPVTFTVSAGQTYSVLAVFEPISPLVPTPSLNFSTAAIIVLLPGVGGTTTPRPGTYALANATTFNLSATPNSGWQFSHWTISGNSTAHGGYPYTATPTDNPYNINHGYGYTYYYQPVFTPTSTSGPTPSPTIPEYSSAIVITVVAVLAAVAVGTFAFKRKK